jgi:hypothetical protein
MYFSQRGHLTNVEVMKRPDGSVYAVIVTDMSNDKGYVLYTSLDECQKTLDGMRKDGWIPDAADLE